MCSNIQHEQVVFLHFLSTQTQIKNTNHILLQTVAVGMRKKRLVVLDMASKTIHNSNEIKQSSMNYCHTVVLQAQFAAGGHFAWDTTIKYFLQSIL